MILEITRLKGKQFVICGMRDQGKTTFAKELLSGFRRSVVFDTLNEYKDFYRYIPKTRNAGEELEGEFNLFWNRINKKHIDCICVDEANRVAPRAMKATQAVRDIVDMGRHIEPPFFGCAYIFIARRPTQMFTDAVELADFLVFFRLDGKNDIEYLNDVRTGLGDLVQTLKPHEFVIYARAQGRIAKCMPLKIAAKKISGGVKELNLRESAGSPPKKKTGGTISAYGQNSDSAPSARP